MKLTRLRLVGFKTFVEPTDFLIEPGLTGVVGPNGCGKSNLVEALRWVMGESSHKSLRASGMDDVIFSGSGNRPGAQHRGSRRSSSTTRDRTAPAGLQRCRPARRLPPHRAGVRLHLSGQRQGGARARRAAPVRRRLHRRALARHGAAGADRRDHRGQAAGAPSHPGGRRRHRRAAFPPARGGAAAAGGRGQPHAPRGRAPADRRSRSRACKRQARQASRYRSLASDIRRAEALLLLIGWREAQATASRRPSARSRRTAARWPSAPASRPRPRATRPSPPMRCPACASGDRPPPSRCSGSSRARQPGRRGEARPRPRRGAGAPQLRARPRPRAREDPDRGRRRARWSGSGRRGRTALADEAEGGRGGRGGGARAARRAGGDAVRFRGRALGRAVGAVADRNARRSAAERAVARGRGAHRQAGARGRTACAATSPRSTPALGPDGASAAARPRWSRSPRRSRRPRTQAQAAREPHVAAARSRRSALRGPVREADRTRPEAGDRSADAAQAALDRHVGATMAARHRRRHGRARLRGGAGRRAGRRSRRLHGSAAPTHWLETGAGGGRSRAARRRRASLADHVDAPAGAARRLAPDRRRGRAPRASGCATLLATGPAARLARGRSLALGRVFHRRRRADPGGAPPRRAQPARRAEAAGRGGARGGRAPAHPGRDRPSSAAAPRRAGRNHGLRGRADDAPRARRRARAPRRGRAPAGRGRGPALGDGRSAEPPDPRGGRGRRAARGAGRPARRPSPRPRELEAALERARATAVRDRQAANDARLLVQNWKREAETRGRRLAAIAHERTAWDERRRRATGQIDEIERRQAEVEAELDGACARRPTPSC